MEIKSHTKTSQLLDEVRSRFDSDFNFISLQLLEKAYPNLYEYVIYPDNCGQDGEEMPYPMWSTLFEAKDQMLSDMLYEKVNELADIGIYLMQVDETNVMLFINGAGYNFYDSHWIPLYRDVLQWIKETD